MVSSNRIMNIIANNTSVRPGLRKIRFYPRVNVNVYQVILKVNMPCQNGAVRVIMNGQVNPICGSMETNCMIEVKLN